MSRGLALVVSLLVLGVGAALAAARGPRGYARFFAGLFALGLGLTACGLLPAKAPDVDPCAAEITRLEGLRSVEVYGACATQSFEECSPVIERIDAKYAPLILEQVRCGSDH